MMSETVEQIADQIVCQCIDKVHAIKPEAAVWISEQIRQALTAERQRAAKAERERNEAVAENMNLRDILSAIDSVSGWVGSKEMVRVRSALSAPPSAHLPALVARVKAEETERCAQKVGRLLMTKTNLSVDLTLDIEAAIRAKE